MSKMLEIVSKCKAEVSIEFNAHKSCYESIEESLTFGDMRPETEIEDPEVLAKMIELDRMIKVQFYPDTPVGFYTVYHHDLDSALDECLEILKGEGK